MLFVYPSFLFALAAVAIPIIIHLFNFRRYKKIVFSDIRFLKQVIGESQKQQKLKNILVLISRILAIACLVLAFAQPYIPFQQSKLVKGSKAVSIYIDNSFSMTANGTNGELLETARNKARELTAVYSDADQFQLLTNDFEGRHQRLVSKKDFLQMVDEVKASPSSRPISEIISRQKQVFEKAGYANKISYLVSDFQQKFSDFEKMRHDSDLEIRLIPVQTSEQSNLFIDSAWLINPYTRLNEPVRMKVRIRNISNGGTENQPLVLKINGAQKGLQNFSCDENSFTDVELNFTLTSDDWQQGELSITDYPVTFDDKFFFTLRPSTFANVLVINGSASAQNSFIQKVYKSDPFFKVTEQLQQQLDYSIFKNQALIFLNEPADVSTGLMQELNRYVEAGGNLVVLPPAETGTLAAFNTFASSAASINYSSDNRHQPLLKAEKLNLQDEIFRGVFMKTPQNMDAPSVSRCYRVNVSASVNGTSLITMNNGDPLIFKAKRKKGYYFFSAIPFREDWSTFPRHAFYVPFMLRLALSGLHAQEWSYSIDENNWVRLENEVPEKVVHLAGANFEMVTDAGLRDGQPGFAIDRQIKGAGNYEIYVNDRKRPIGFIGMNYKRAESYTTLMTHEALEKLKSDHNIETVNDDISVMQKKISLEENGMPLWRYMLLLSLLFIACEIALLKWMR